eukprot:scaffold286778_cov14-Tisochrysis_lutea.AAC.1
MVQLGHSALILWPDVVVLLLGWRWPAHQSLGGPKCWSATEACACKRASNAQAVLLLAPLSSSSPVRCSCSTASRSSTCAQMWR